MQIPWGLQHTYVILSSLDLWPLGQLWLHILKEETRPTQCSEHRHDHTLEMATSALEVCSDRPRRLPERRKSASERVLRGVVSLAKRMHEDLRCRADAICPSCGLRKIRPPIVPLRQQNKFRRLPLQHCDDTNYNRFIWPLGCRHNHFRPIVCWGVGKEGANA